MRTLTAVRVFVYCCIALPASAQATFADLHVTGQPTVYVTNLFGRETKGKLVEGAYCALVCGQGVSNGGEYVRVVAFNTALPIAADAAVSGRTRIWPITKGRSQ